MRDGSNSELWDRDFAEDPVVKRDSGDDLWERDFEDTLFERGLKDDLWDRAFDEDPLVISERNVIASPLPFRPIPTRPRPPVTITVTPPTPPPGSRHRRREIYEQLVARMEMLLDELE